MSTPRPRSMGARVGALMCAATLLVAASACSGEDKDDAKSAEPPTAEESALCDAYANLLRAQQSYTLKPKQGSAQLQQAAAQVSKLTRPESLSEGAFATLEAQAELFSLKDPLAPKAQKAFQKKLAELGPEAFGELSTFTGEKCTAQLTKLQEEAAASAHPAATAAPSSAATN